MSLVTNVMVSVSISEDDDVVVGLGEPIKDDGTTRQSLSSLVDERTEAVWGGYKQPECVLWGAIFNYVTTDEVLAFVAAIDWKYPAEVQVFVKEQDDDRFRVYQFIEGKELEMVL